MTDILDVRSVAPDALAIWLEQLAANLRPGDIDEIAAASGEDPLVALRLSVIASDMCWIALHDLEPVAIFGVAPTVPLSGMVWMVGTPKMDELGRKVLRVTRPYLDRMHERYAVLWNHIDARNSKSMRWLEWCGFRLIEALPDHGPERRLFFTFARYDPTHV